MAHKETPRTLISQRIMKKARLYFVDNLRTLMIAMVIVLHVSVIYGGEGLWYYYKEGRADIVTSSILSVHNAIVMSFFMGMLFLVSGYFTPASFDRKGAGRFLRDRLIRLGIPLLCFDLVIDPLLVYKTMASADGFDGTFGQVLARHYSTFNIGTGPLWFVEVLLMFICLFH